MESFTFRSARSTSLLVALGAIIVIETTVIHLLLFRAHPVAAWGITGSSLALLAWLLLDYRRLGDGALRLDDGMLTLAVGLRFAVRVPCVKIAEASIPTWRDLPTSPSAYLNGTKPATPNLLLSFREPVTIRLLGVVDRAVSQLGLCLDDPASFLAALAKHAAAEHRGHAT
jgi:hypothetical protein